MGCGSSSPSGGTAPAGPSKGRDGKDPGDEHPGGQHEDNRMLIDKLGSDSVVSMAPGQGRKISICSCTEDVKDSFTEKSRAQVGDMDVGGLGPHVGFTCRKGLKPEQPNQDSWSILKVEDDVSIYGVYDGHGRKGHDGSEFVKEVLPKLIVRDPRFKTNLPECLKDNFLKAQDLVITEDHLKRIACQMSGTTVSMVVHDHVSNKLTFSHCADSTCVLGAWADAEKSKVEVVYATRDHKPDLEDENRRITTAGGTVVFDGYQNHRVYAKGQKYPGLNMSRCMGDLKGHSECGLSAEPEIKEIEVKPEHHVLLVCSDGVWEFMEPPEVLEFVMRQPVDQAMKTAQALAQKAWDRWIEEEDGDVVDDITVIIAYLNASK